MNNIIEVIKGMPDYIGSDGRKEEDVYKAESDLGLSFSNEYREYLKEIGLACFDGHELTGLTSDNRLDVVEVTKAHREYCDGIKMNWYVIEEVGIDDVVIWQDENGLVYRTIGKTEGVLVANSLREYVLKG